MYRQKLKMNWTVVKVSFCLVFASETMFGRPFVHSSIFISTVIDVILEPQFELFKFLVIIQIIVIQNPELWYSFTKVKPILFRDELMRIENLLGSKMVWQQLAIEWFFGLPQLIEFWENHCILNI